MRGANNLSTIFLSFFKVGITSFGGHAALVSVVQEEFVKNKKIVTDEELITAMAIASVLPGPLAVNVVTYIGYKLDGWLGAITSLVAVVLPPSCMIVIIAQLYSYYSNLALLNSFLYGILPVIIGLILSLCFNLFRKEISRIWQYILFIVIFVSAFFFSTYLYIVMFLAIGGVVGLVLNKKNKVPSLKEKIKLDADNLKSLYIGFTLFAVLFLVTYFVLHGIYHQLFFEFSKISLTLFGGGYIMIPMLYEIVVDKFQWLSSNEFSYAIAFGQITPGPILISATYVGFVTGDIAGALIATVGIFVPSAVVMVMVSSLFENVKEHPKVIAALKGIRPVIIALIAYSGWILFRTLEHHLISGLMIVIVFLLLVYTKINYLLLVLFGGIIGILFL